MQHDLIISKSIDINATREKVWEGLTNPAIIKEYLYGTNTVTNWQVGSEVVFEGEYNGVTYSDHGVVMENIPYLILSYTYWSGFSGLPNTPENHSLITYTLLEKEGGIIEFTWTQKGFANQEGLKHSEMGMDDFLKSIKGIIER